MAAPGPAPEFLNVNVSPEWAVAVSGINTAHLGGALARPDLWQELQLLEKLLYKNSNQHRGAQHFQRLQEVRRLLVLLKGMQLERWASAFHTAFQAAKQWGVLPAGSVLMTYGGDQRRVPSHGMAVALLRTLRAACQLVEQLAPAVHRASLQLLAQLAHSFFMPLCLTSLAALARIQVLTGQLLLDVVRAYNVLAEVAALLPISPPADAAATATCSPSELSCQEEQQPGQELPQMLRVQWCGGLPLLEAVPCGEGDSLAAQAAGACARYGVNLVQSEAMVAAAAAAATLLQQQQGRRQRGQQPPPVLAVVEDRGVPVSREAFASVAAAAVGGDAAEGPAVAALAPAAAADAADAEPAVVPPLLLGLVEDSMPEEDASGVVASLMEGEARGHLYRRTALGLGQLGQLTKVTEQGKQAAPAGTTKGAAVAAPAVGVAKATPAGGPDKAAAGAAAVAGEVPAGVESAAPIATTGTVAAAAPSVPKPEILSVVAPPVKPSPRPAFRSVAAPASKPAFLSVAAPASKPVFLSVAAPAAPQAAGQLLGSTDTGAAVAKAAAAPLALDLSIGRKRKKPLAAGAAAAVEVEQQQAAASKSWEDWLEPLPGAGTAAPAGLQQGQGKQQQQQQGKRRKGR